MKVITIVDVNTLYSGKLCSFNTFYCFYEYVLFGVNRFCDILLVLQKFKSLWQLVKGLFSIWQHFEPTLCKYLFDSAIFNYCKLSTIEKEL